MTADTQRSERIVDCLGSALATVTQRDPQSARRRFRAMAEHPFAFYRGSTALFYADVAEQEDPWAGSGALSTVWIHGDLHAENFGTYMDSRGILIFDVNDFDEAYLGRFTWDLLRCAGSLALIGWRKAFPDEVIGDLVDRYVRTYVDQVRRYAKEDDDHVWALRLDTARGPVLDTLRRARHLTRVAMLESQTLLDGDQRSLPARSGFRRLEEEERARVLAAYEDYLRTIPAGKRLGDVAYEVKDVAGRVGVGIGSAGLTSYTVLLEGRSQALQDDVLLVIREGARAAASAVVDDEAVTGMFEHDGHRTAVSQLALQVHADPYLGWTRLDGAGYVVRELQPWQADLDWGAVSEPEEVAGLVADLGRATAKVHCVSDADAGPATGAGAGSPAGSPAGMALVEGQVENLVLDRVDGAVDELSRWVRERATAIAEGARADHALFVDAFRAGAFSGVRAT